MALSPKLIFLSVSDALWIKSNVVLSDSLFFKNSFNNYLNTSSGYIPLINTL